MDGAISSDLADNPARQLFHTGILVDDIDAAMHELSEIVGITWATPRELCLTLRTPHEVMSITFVMTYSLEGSHRLELVVAVPGTPWELIPGRGIHHLGYWVDDLDVASRDAAARGWPLVAMHEPEPGEWRYFAYHQTSAGLLIELVDRRLGSMFERWLGASIG